MVALPSDFPDSTASSASSNNCPMCKSSVGVGLLSAVLLACGGSSPGSAPPTPDSSSAPQGSFVSSACKESSTAKNPGLLVIDSETGLEGLCCVAWERIGSDEIKLDLYNFDGACGASWTGNGALASDGSLSLHIDKPSCQLTQCGVCLYDWSFDLHVLLPTAQEVPIVVAVDACDGQQATVYRQAVIGAEQQGIRCTQADYAALIVHGVRGEVGMPCGGGSAETCTAGLLCDSELTASDLLCFVPCTTAGDCPRSDIYACQAGLCRPTGLGN